MNTINYRRHFALLVLAACLLPLLLEPVARVLPVTRFHVYFGLVGLLHASAWVLALRVATPWTRRLMFILTAATLSIAAPYLGVSLAMVSPRAGNDIGVALAFAGASAAGTAVYWLAIRRFWLPHLALRSLATTVAMCAAATPSSMWVGALLGWFGSRPDGRHVDLLSSFWWLAFSTAIFLEERRLPNKPMQPTSSVAEIGRVERSATAARA